MAVTPSSTYVTFDLSKFQEFPKHFERSKAIERLERLERTDLRDERSEAIERLERLELATAYVKVVSMDSQEISNRLDEGVHGAINQPGKCRDLQIPPNNQYHV